MSLPVPQLDDLDFDALVAEARSLIPRFAPEWTDHNLHDPGITMIELLAWMVDQEIFRIGFVGDRYRRAFAALLGERPKRPIPARGLLWPPAPTRAEVLKAAGGYPPNAGDLPDLLLPQGTVISCLQQPDTPFLLECDIFLTAARLLSPGAIGGGKTTTIAALTTSEGTRYTAGMPGGATHIELPFNRPLVLPTNPPGHVQTISLGIAVEAFVASDDKEVKTWGPLTFEYRVDNGEWATIEVQHDGTFALGRTGAVLLKVPAMAGSRSALRMRLDRGFFPIAPTLRRFAVNVLPVAQMQEVAAQVLGRGNGRPDQIFNLDTLFRVPEPRRKDDANAPEIKPLRIKIDNDPCMAVGDLTRSEPRDRHYITDIQRGRIRFGNGVNGLMPPNGSQVRCDAFHVTQGMAGNIGGRRKWRIGGITAVFTNPEPIVGGRDATTLDELLAAARARIVNRDALLSNEELKAAARGLVGFAVKRAEIRVRHDPTFPAHAIRGTRSLIVIPARDLSVEPHSAPRAYLDALKDTLSFRRLLGERLSVLAADYTSVDLEVSVLISTEADAEEVRGNVEARLRARLSDLPRHPAIEPWPLGRPVTCREIQSLAAAVPGIIAVRRCRLAKADEVLGETDISLAPTAVAIARQLNVKTELFGSA